MVVGMVGVVRFESKTGLVERLAYCSALAHSYWFIVRFIAFYGSLFGNPKIKLYC